MREVFRCKTIAFVGDSVVRTIAMRMLRSLYRKKSWKHSNYHQYLKKGDIQIDFFWQPRVRLPGSCINCVSHLCIGSAVPAHALCATMERAAARAMWQSCAVRVRTITYSSALRRLTVLPASMHVLVLQLAGMVEKIVNWTATGYRPDIVVTGSGAHSMFSHFRADEFRGALTAGISAFKAWRNALARARFVM